MPMGKLQGRVCIISGAAQGMGAAHARVLASAGASVLACDVLDPEIPFDDPSIRFHRLDVTSEDGWRAAVAEAEMHFGDVSILVNNAGIFGVGPIADLDLTDFKKILEVNLVGTFMGMKAVIGSMRRAGQGSIINISSTAGFAAHAGMAAYTSSKFAVRGITRVAALEFAAHNVRVNSIHPGGVRTPMVAGAGELTGIPIPRFAEPEEISRMVLFLASDDSSYSTGSEFVADGGYLAVVGHQTL